LIYLDTSVALARLFGEDRTPPSSLWKKDLVSSRLLEYELWTRVHARRLTESHREQARQILAEVTFLELAALVLVRALDPFPIALRTLDALHLASIEFLRTQGRRVELATYDERLAAAAEALGIPLLRL
jgi:predicted nucleic acid-binding protein